MVTVPFDVRLTVPLASGLSSGQMTEKLLKEQQYTLVLIKGTTINLIQNAHKLENLKCENE